MEYEAECLLHKFKYGHGPKPEGVTYVACPLCSQKSIKELRDRAETAERRLSVLCEAIEIKSTVEILKEPPSGN